METHLCNLSKRPSYREIMILASSNHRVKTRIHSNFATLKDSEEVVPHGSLAKLYHFYSPAMNKLLVVDLRNPRRAAE
ncbi:hypothetical protein FPOAC1_002484 [Fusarium poae]|uniref:hypothetical protein n=1 Tax=Fusarium poae TaxID=36050 RepID=UPI001CE9C745|nr:hypothetical protein FPOAC1_002484 [Fusarium poae]KAG8676480.1 hypothetical protein FPOAC1_002484 [Fusarium poae]